jgi:hypothetical protein
MESILDALPAQPLTAEAVEALNDAAPLRLIPYSWSGRQAVTLVLDERGELSGEGPEPPPAASRSGGRAFDSSDASDAGADEKRESSGSSGFDTSDSGAVGSVEVVEESLLPDGNPFADLVDGENRTVESAGTSQPEADDGTGSTSADSSIWAAGYDPDEATWVRIDGIEAGTAFGDIEPLVREWLSETYSEEMVERIVVGPSEYDDSG